jgi:hypothetical protein
VYHHLCQLVREEIRIHVQLAEGIIMSLASSNLTSKGIIRRVCTTYVLDSLHIQIHTGAARITQCITEITGLFFSLFIYKIIFALFEAISVLIILLFIAGYSYYESVLYIQYAYSMSACNCANFNAGRDCRILFCSIPR